MRKRVLVPFPLLLALVVACLLFAIPAGADPIVSIQPVRAMDPSGNPVGDTIGTSRLVRDVTGLSFELTTSKLAPLHPHTVWWILLNKEKKVLLASYATGAVALPNGVASFSASLSVGALPKVDGKAVMEVLAGGKFDDPMGVTVQLILRDHGPIVLDRLVEQLTTFEADCAANVCKDPQIVIHAP